MVDDFFSAIPMLFSSRMLRRCALFVVISGLFVTFHSVDSLSECKGHNPPKVCGEGECVNGTCICFPGWGGEFCHLCDGRISLDSKEGIIYDGAESYVIDSMCSWLLDTHSDTGNASVRFVFNSFATECGWDHLYVHDGDSAFAPLLAAYSGLLFDKAADGSSYELNLRFTGRYGYLHFYSDAAYIMPGFNISYSVGGCYLNCSGHGQCVDGVCQCDPGMSGDGCEVDLLLCQNNCSSSGNCSSGKCQCDSGFMGEDCSLTAGDILWEQLPSVNMPSGRASHVALLDDGLMWIVGGYSLADPHINKLVTYNLSSHVWQNVTEATGNNPWPLYAHTAVMFENKLYVFGGVRNGLVKDELWAFNMTSSTWSQLSASGYPVSGHTAHVYQRTMLVFFGYSPVFGYMNRVQQYDFDTGEWSMLETSGSDVQGGYGHASVLDTSMGKIFVHGGYHSHSEMPSSTSSYNLTDVLYAYDPANTEWMVLHNSGYPRYLHAMVAIGGYLLVFGGNTHNDTSKSRGAKCFSSDFMLYDIKCNTWFNMSVPNLNNVARFGHTMIDVDEDIFLFGGFDSLMLRDVIHIKLGDCGHYANNVSCAQALPGKRCFWNGSVCERRRQDADADDVCDAAGRDLSTCPSFNTCSSCLAAQNTCNWCSNNCTAFNCTNSDKMKTAQGPCPPEDAGCGLYHVCQACMDDLRCMWENSGCKIRTGSAVNVTANRTELQATCHKQPCTSHSGCKNCTETGCMWCSNLAICIDTNAYVASFPYGQCMDWTTKSAKCEVTKCAGLKSCMECLANSQCGWCNDASDTGLGICMEGGQLGPRMSAGLSSSPQCPASRWHFTTCPLCQCNGHSTCIGNSSICESCQFPTIGDQCQYCQHFYYGNPVHGGNCSECQCNGQADFCSHETGQCYCRTRGVTGEHCDKCDADHKYFGDPKNGGTCYYKLSTDYQYTFNLSKTDDKNYTQINFLSIPGSGDRDVDFTLNCSGFALLNITFRSKSLAEEQWITISHECDYFRTKFEHKDFAFGGDYNSTFFVYVFDFRTPFWLQISFSQFPKIDLVHFFITFFSCFLSLLLIAAALWKIKHKYDGYRRRQQLMVEMQQMASRPFSSVCIEVEKKGELAAGVAPERKELKDHVDTALRRRKKLANKPSAIAIEPLAGNKAAVLTLLIQLPFGDGEFAPSGQSGMAVGSAFVSMGTIRKQSLEHIKGDKPKIRKHLLYTHPDALA